MTSCALFTGLSVAECLLLAQSARTVAFDRGELLFHQGEPIRKVFVINSGSVKLTRIAASGSEVIMWLRGPGETVDVLGAAGTSLHSCSARVTARCKVLEWNSLLSLESSPVRLLLQRNMGYILAERINELEERFHEVATEKVSTRVACALVRICKKVGNTSHDGTIIWLCREEIAQLTGTTLFTISRLMTKWSDLGLVEPRREAVLVRDPAKFLQRVLSGTAEPAELLA